MGFFTYSSIWDMDLFNCHCRMSDCFFVMQALESSQLAERNRRALRSRSRTGRRQIRLWDASGVHKMQLARSHFFSQTITSRRSTHSTRTIRRRFKTVSWRLWTACRTMRKSISLVTSKGMWTSRDGLPLRNQLQKKPWFPHCQK